GDLHAVAVDGPLVRDRRPQQPLQHRLVDRDQDVVEADQRALAGGVQRRDQAGLLALEQRPLGAGTQSTPAAARRRDRARACGEREEPPTHHRATLCRAVFAVNVSKMRAVPWLFPWSPPDTTRCTCRRTRTTPCTPAWGGYSESCARVDRRWS